MNKELKALSNIRHDGQDYVKGDQLVVSDADAKALIEAGVVEVVDAESPKAAQPKPESADIWNMDRKELNDYADSIGIDSKAYGNKNDLIDAIQHLKKGDVKAPVEPVAPVEEAPVAPEIPAEEPAQAAQPKPEESPEDAPESTEPEVESPTPAEN